MARKIVTVTRTDTPTFDSDGRHTGFREGPTTRVEKDASLTYTRDGEWSAFAALCVGAATLLSAEIIGGAIWLLGIHH